MEKHDTTKATLFKGGKKNNYVVFNKVSFKEVMLFTMLDICPEQSLQEMKQKCRELQNINRKFPTSNRVI